ncbi:MAG: aspartate--tRNA ligase [Chlorobi bacterium]|nr:MAG: aspartate--tRNA ligase [Bacteroidota bacterium]KXK35073.1 MAG: aspartyl-tRNA synthetase [Chlorobi bacterium OLB6]MBE2265575.1 aspartate--tRNA ligase [Flavobacteriales bacterium]MBL1161725.1 aspartate--tRNA ligase [Chlorobiota bacterium]MBW7853913.1 aspartate--tRNA ligase [Candidatus Kapabacteria bacterium]MCC6331790.1 aspartate--tRNA ligase [Ignavibacteria bacterium]
MNYKQRTVTCGALRPEDAGKAVVLNGWVNAHRNYGSVHFIDVRDREGVTQIVIDAADRPDLSALIKDVRSEWVIWAAGTVRLRENPNPNIPTGLVEIDVADVGVINRSEVPPFEVVNDLATNEELRLEYRYLDLRRPLMQSYLLLRNKLYQLTHKFFEQEGFVEVETPVLTRSTPEGARDFLVPSRLNQGRFYALPQSPQLFKQLLMVAGFDKYMQIVKAFRDEDLRADRQPEFTQIDVEMSFVDQADVMGVAERFVQVVWHELLGVSVQLPLPRITYADAMNTYGTDKPDLRYDLPLKTITNDVKECSFSLFKEAAAQNRTVKVLRVPDAATFSRKQIDELTDHARIHGAQGLPYLKYAGSELTGSFAKQLTDGDKVTLVSACGAKDGDLLLFSADEWERSCVILGALRVEVARRLDLPAQTKAPFAMLWVTEFPLLEHDPQEARWVARHHPFTSPMVEDIGMLDEDPTAVRARAYDLVINGYEAAGGSIRIHDRTVQQKMFALIGMSAEEAEAKFGFLLKALRYGAPPHGGIAFGFDRLTMLLSGTNNIREVIAFPKTTSGLSLMDKCPSAVDDTQLADLGIGLRK